MREALKRSDALVRKAAGFDEAAVLRSMRPSPLNGFFYRFDDHLDEAEIVSPRPGPEEKSTSVLFGLEFNGDDPVRLRHNGKNVITSGGVMKLTCGPSFYLENIDDLNVKISDIGEIIVRAKFKKSRRFKINLNHTNIPWEKRDVKKTNQFILDTIPDNRFHIYRFSGISVVMLAGGARPQDTLNQIIVLPTNKIDDRIEIDYIRLVSKMHKYRQSTVGTTYEVLNKEMRKAVYANTPSSMKFTLTLPPKAVTLSFGTGIVKDGPRVRFAVRVEGAKSAQEIFAEEIDQPDRWHDARLDLSPWKGERVNVVFEAQGDGQNVALWSNPVVTTAPRKRLNVIIILQDALRADHLSCYGYPRPTTPLTDALAKNGVIFLNAFSQAPKTRQSVASLMTSLYPSTTGIWNAPTTLPEQYLTLAEIMRASGFVTAAFVQNGNAGPRSGLHQGFSYEYVFKRGVRPSEKICNRRLFDFLKKNEGRNLFLYIHLLDPHAPYDPPRPYDDWYRKYGPGTTPAPADRGMIKPPWLKTPPTIEGWRLLYDGEIRHNDHVLGKFIKRLRRNGLIDDTLFIFIADHGEHLGDHGLGMHRSPNYLQVIKVPLIMVYPREFPGHTKIRQPVQLLDIMPTILDVARIDKSPLLEQGDSLLPLIFNPSGRFWNDRVCVSDEVIHEFSDNPVPSGSVLFRGWHILDSQALPASSANPLIFNYRQDPKEAAPQREFMGRRDLEQGVRRFLKHLQDNNAKIQRYIRKDVPEASEQDQETQQQLRALGYLQ